MSYVFDPRNGLGEVLEQANRDWNTRLMPDYIEQLVQQVASEYTRYPGQDFNLLLERVLDIEDLDPPLSDDERHAAKFAIGTIFGNNRRDRKAQKKEAEARMREFIER